MKILPYLLVMALTTYLIRVIPFTLIRKKIRSRYIRSLLYYIPYAVLAAMTFPAVFYASGSVLASIVGAALALVLASFNLPMIVVALAASVGTFIMLLL